MDNKKLVPQIRFKGFHDEWKEKDFKDITFLVREKNKNNVPYESYSVTNENGFIPQSQNFTNSNNLQNANKRLYNIVTQYSFAYNPARINVGSIGYYNGNKTIIVSSLYEVFKTNKMTDDNFLWIWFKSDKFKKYILQYQEGGVRLYFYYDKLCLCNIIIPTLNEQKKISKLFENIDTLISKKQIKLEKVKALKQTLLKKMFPSENSDVPEIRFKGFTEKWEKKKLGSIGNTYNGLTGKTKEDFGHGEAHYITYLNVFNNPIIDTKMLETIEIDFKQNKVLYGDIFFTTSSETPEEVGMSSVWLYNHDNIYLNSFCFGYRLDNINEYNLLYFTYTLRSLFVRKKITILAQGISRYNISKTKLMDLKIILPNKIEQEKIGKYFYKLDNLINLYEKEIEKLQKLKKAFFGKMFV